MHMSLAMYCRERVFDCSWLNAAFKQKKDTMHFVDGQNINIVILWRLRVLRGPLGPG